jgi:hypothetical protein
MKLKSKIININDITEDHKNSMFTLMLTYFENMEKKVFLKDLNEKRWVIILYDKSEKNIKGFSTQMMLEAQINNKSVKAIFSGDTIIDKDYWGTTQLMKSWLELMFNECNNNTNSELYWMLISMGYRTYRFLPIFFKKFYPNYKTDTPIQIKQIIDTFASKKYPEEYIKNRGIIRPKNTTYLKKGVSDINNSLLRNPHISFFKQKNPGYMQGDELICLTKLSRDNFKPALYRICKNNA